MNKVGNINLAETDFCLAKVARIMRVRAGKSKDMKTSLSAIDAETKDYLLLHYHEKASLLLAELSEEKARYLKLQASMKE